MSRIPLTLAVLLSWLPAARADAPAANPESIGAASKSPPRKSAGKPQAPVKAEADLSADGAHLRITFQASANNVRIQVYGVDGLEVKGDPGPRSSGSYEKGETAELDVAFTKQPEGRSRLAVSVSGNFGGVRRSATASFAVGAPTEAQKRDSGGKVERTPSGERIKVAPAEER